MTNDRIVLANGATIAVVPCDASSAAGANPSLTVFTEVWAYTSDQKKRLWAEMTPPPTRPDALRLVESYSGYIGQDTPLRSLYENTVLNGTRYRYLPDLPVWVDEDARVFYYYDTLPDARRFPWQTDQYYNEQLATLPPLEFQRIHANNWVGSSAESLRPEWLEMCIREEKILPGAISVIGVDAGVTRSAFAAAVVHRNPDSDTIIVSDLRVWSPGRSPLDYQEIEQTILELIERYQPVEVAYDPYQLHEMMQRISRGYIAYTRPFNQNKRGIADMQLLRTFQSRRLAIPPSVAEVLRSHYNSVTVVQSGSTQRFAPSSPGKNIDAMVALAMAVSRVLAYSP